MNMNKFKSIVLMYGLQNVTRVQAKLLQPENEIWQRGLNVKFMNGCSKDGNIIHSRGCRDMTYVQRKAVKIQ